VEADTREDEMGHIAGQRDRDLHVGGGHRSIAPSADGAEVERFERRMAEHRAAHDAEVHKAEVHKAELWWYAGAPFHVGTNLPNNVTGECSHRHNSPDAAKACIVRVDASMKRGFYSVCLVTSGSLN
jgi:hypothetical protein